MELIGALLAYFIIPLGVAIFAYILLHFQLIFLGKMMDFKFHRSTRLKISVAAFLGTFIGVLCLSILRGVYNG